jgi:hypothetical protein
MSDEELAIFLYRHQLIYADIRISDEELAISLVQTPVDLCRHHNMAAMDSKFKSPRMLYF